MAKLSELCDIQYGYAFDSSAFTKDNTYPQLARIRDVKRGYSETFYNGNFPEEYVLSAGDLLIGMDGEFNIARWKVNGALLNQRVCKIVAKDNVDEEFLRFALSKALKVIEERASFVTVKHLSAKELNKLEIPVPTYVKQKKISAILRRLEKIITSRQTELNKLNELVKARFVEMFGNIGQDNKGWRLTTLGKACIINPHRSKDINTNLEYSFVPMPSVSEHGSIDASECKQYDEVKNGYTYFQENDVLFAKITPCMENGKGAVAQGLKNGIGFGSTEFHILRPIDGISNPYWLYEITMQPQFRIFAERHMTGSGGQRRVPASFLKNFPISIPPLDLQNHYADFFQQVDKSKQTSILSTLLP